MILIPKSTFYKVRAHRAISFVSMQSNLLNKILANAIQ